MRWIRLILCLLILICCYGMGHWLLRAQFHQQRVESWKTAVVADFPIDLSRSTPSTGILHQATSRPCEQLFLVQVDKEGPIQRDILGSVFGEIMVLDEQQIEILRTPFNAALHSESRNTTANQFLIAAIRPFDEGTYSLRIQATNTAPLLAGIRHKLVVKYQLCGLESMVVLVCYGFSAGCAVPVLILGYCLYRTCHSRKAKDNVPRDPMVSPPVPGTQ